MVKNDSKSLSENIEQRGVIQLGCVLIIDPNLWLDENMGWIGRNYLILRWRLDNDLLIAKWIICLRKHDYDFLSWSTIINQQLACIARFMSSKKSPNFSIILIKMCTGPMSMDL